MKIIELVIDEENFKDGVFAISLVDEPAIESDFVALSKTDDAYKLATVDEEKRIVMGPVLIPDFPILRKTKDGEPYYILFREKTIRDASQLYMKKGNQANTTLDHQIRVEGATVVETWLKEHEEFDKSNIHQLNAPVGSWLVSMRIDNDEVWNDYVKTGKVKGFSIEGLFEDENVVKARNEKIDRDEFFEIVNEFLNMIENDK